MQNIIENIKNAKTSLGIELGSTRIKAVLIDDQQKVLATGGFSWENTFKDSVWTYDLDLVWQGIAECYKSMCDDVFSKYGIYIKNIGSIGFSGMMHGYLPFDKNDNQLALFKTWRNTDTHEASAKLINEFNFNVPQRFSISHLYKNVLENVDHVQNIDFLTTLAGYVHYKLTGMRVLGIGEASGMFPIDSKTFDYNQTMVDKFDKLIEKYPFKVRDILPKVLKAGEFAGTLTEEGAKLLDKSGKLKAGIPLCPPEGDAGTGMVATNSIRQKTGNISAGTSVFAMIVLENELSKVYEQIDMVTTPTGSPVAMVHCNNCTNEINAWVEIFGSFLTAYGVDVDKNKLFETFFKKALEGDPNAGSLVAYNYLSGEHITGFNEGVPLFMHSKNSNFTLENFAKSQLNSACATLKIGMDILFLNENVHIDKLLGHGGFFTTENVGASIMANALNTPIEVLKTASEGGAFGIAVLANYMNNTDVSFEDFLEFTVFKDEKSEVTTPDEANVKGFLEFLDNYKKGLQVEKTATEVYM